jgi:hypothetical protein
MTSYILYSNTIKKKDNGKNLPDYLVEQIDDTIFKRMQYNDIHKKFSFQIPRSHISDKFLVKKLLKDKKNDKKKDKPTHKHVGNETDDIVNVIMMPELTKKQVRTYLNMYNDEPDNIKKYAEYLAIISYNQVYPEKFQVKKYFQKLLEEQSSFWEDNYNCNITLNNIFIKRRFNYDSYSQKILEKAGSNKLLAQMKSIKESDLNYLNELNRYSEKEFLFKSGNNYWTGTQSVFTNQETIELYGQIPTEYLKYNFLCNMICSRTHCHLILNNLELLKMAKPIIEKYKLVFKYVIGYGWLTLRQEEISNRNKLKDNDRIIFDIDTASFLPIFPFSIDDINQNPYAGILLDDKLMNVKENCVSMNMIKNNYTKYYGLPDKETFKKRLNIFVNGQNKDGILSKIDWSKFVITGSAMTACGMKYNPLMDMFKTNANGDLTDGDFSAFLFHYYNNSDIDILSTHDSIFDYLDAVDKLITLLSEESSATLEKTNVHIASIILSEEFMNIEMDELKKFMKDQTINVDWLKKNYENPNVKKYFYDKFYVPWKQDQINYILTNKPTMYETYVYTEYLKYLSSEDFRIYTLDYEVDAEHQKKNDNEKSIYNSSNILICKLSESIRFQVKSKNLNRSWEIFKSRNDQIFSTVGKFHMGFVRACWNGTTLLCTPSFISSMMLQMSTDYKYFASVRDPIEIINKYRSRGFGILLNDSERIHMAYYNSIKPEGGENKWCDMYNVNIKNKQSIISMFGPKKTNDQIFKPSKFFEGMPDDCFKNVEHQFVSDAKEAFSSLYSDETLELYKYKCITQSGYVNPLNREVIKRAYDIINKTA